MAENCLALSLAVCYCNDIYREVEKRNLKINKVEGELTSDFGSEGEAGRNFRYKPTIESRAHRNKFESWYNIPIQLQKFTTPCARV